MLDESPILCVAHDGGLKLGDLPFVLEPQYPPPPHNPPRRRTWLVESNVVVKTSLAPPQSVCSLRPRGAWQSSEQRLHSDSPLPENPEIRGSARCSRLGRRPASGREPAQNKPDDPAQPRTRFRQTQGSKAPTPHPSWDGTCACA